MEQVQALQKREPLNIDFTRGIVPQNYKEAMQMAALLHKSGLAPKSLDTVEKVAVACFMCLELGRPIMTGIQDIGVINGRAGIFGDAALALVRASGKLEYIKETESGTPYTDDWTFRCEIKRKDSPVPRVGIWTWVDAKRAGLDDPKTRQGGKDMYSPWRRFTRRMMQFKARNFPLRDEFGDVLKGIRLAEDNIDAIDMYEEAPGAYQPSASLQPATTGTPGDEIDLVAKQFAEFAETLDAPLKKVARFVEMTAEANGTTASEIRKSALKKKESFATAVTKWWAREQGKKLKKEAPEAAPASLFSTLKAMRPNTSDKNKRVFRAKVLDNLDEIREWPDMQQDFLRAKWTNTFPEEPFSDILNPPPPPQEEEEPEPQGGEEPPPAQEPPQQEEAGEEEHQPPWERRNAWLKKMEAVWNHNPPVYLTALGDAGYERAVQVPDDPEVEAKVLAAVREAVGIED
ncbi:MAG: hypothetical protein JRI80_04775 [Deltaproteobacteria bacterium]|nr:hypothetical protein [Deltaproteobacteria bacterium]